MKPLWLFLLAFALLSAPATATVQNGDIVVRGDVARLEIERILREDNLDTERLETRDVVELMAAIDRGQAPDDFWEAYQIHLRAWTWYADAEDRARGQEDATFNDAFAELEAAGTAVDSSFEEVERIARNYGARLPAPIGNTRSIA